MIWGRRNFCLVIHIWLMMFVTMRDECWDSRPIYICLRSGKNNFMSSHCVILKNWFGNSSGDILSVNWVELCTVQHSLWRWWSENLFYILFNYWWTSVKTHEILIIYLLFSRASCRMMVGIKKKVKIEVWACFFIKLLHTLIILIARYVDPFAIYF